MRKGRWGVYIGPDEEEKFLGGCMQAINKGVKLFLWAWELAAGGVVLIRRR